MLPASVGARSQRRRCAVPSDGEPHRLYFHDAANDTQVVPPDAIASYVVEAWPAALILLVAMRSFAWIYMASMDD